MKKTTPNKTGLQKWIVEVQTSDRLLLEVNAKTKQEILDQLEAKTLLRDWKPYSKQKVPGVRLITISETGQFIGE